MNRYLVRKGTTVYVQGTGPYRLQRDIVLSYEVTEPLQQFPPEVIAARTDIKGSRFYGAAPTQMFVAGEKLWHEHPNYIIAVHEENLHDHHD